MNFQYSDKLLKYYNQNRDAINSHLSGNFTFSEIESLVFSQPLTPEDEVDESLVSVDDLSIDPDFSFTIHSGSQLLLPMFVVRTREGLATITSKATTLVGSVTNLRRSFPPNRYFNLNGDGPIRDILPDYVNVPVLEQRSNIVDVECVKEYFSKVPVVHSPEEHTLQGSVGKATSVFFDDENMTLYDLSKRTWTLGTKRDTQTRASLIYVTDNPRSEFWVTRSNFKRLLMMAPGKGYTTLKIKTSSLDCTLEFLFDEEDSPPIETLDYQVVEDNDSNVFTLEWFLQQYINRHEHSIESLREEIESTIGHLEFFPSIISLDVDSTTRDMARIMGLRLEKLAGHLPKWRWIGKNATTYRQFALLTQVWINRNAVVHEDFARWRDIDYFAEDWTSIFKEDGVGKYHALAWTYAQISDGLPISSLRCYDQAIVDCLLQSGLLTIQDGVAFKKALQPLRLNLVWYPHYAMMTSGMVINGFGHISQIHSNLGRFYDKSITFLDSSNHFKKTTRNVYQLRTSEKDLFTLRQ